MRGDRIVLSARFDFQKRLEFSDRRRVGWRTFKYYFNRSHGTMFVVTDLGVCSVKGKEADGRQQEAGEQDSFESSISCRLLPAACCLNAQNLFLNLISKL